MSSMRVELLLFLALLILAGATEWDTVAPEEPAFSEWGAWQKCTRRCTQRRTRRCSRPQLCGAQVLREERTCSAGRCPSADGRTAPPDKGGAPAPFGEWGAWDRCGQRCVTKRRRRCQVPEVCGGAVQRETAPCHAEGIASCKGRKKKRRHGKKSGLIEGAAGWSHPLDGVRCGESLVSQTNLRTQLRIIGGREAQPGIWPWQLVLLNRHREAYCAAVLIAPRWALTAAHCVKRRMRVRSGDHDLLAAEGSEQESVVARAFPHPDYDEEKVRADIAVLRLRDPLHMDNRTQPVCLPDAALPDHTRATIIGWGKRDSSSVYGTDRLHQAEVPLVPRAECLERRPELSGTTLCAGYRAGRVDACAGDSGGPLLARTGAGRWTVYGITSFGEGCGEAGKFGFYSDVASFAPWIRKTLAGRH